MIHKRTRRSQAALAAFALIGLISAGCGSDAPSGTGANGRSGSGSGAAHEKAVKFAECMRANGVKGHASKEPSKG